VKKYFKIKQIKKIKILSETFYYIMALSAIGILLFEIFLVPSDTSPGELKALFFIRVLPAWLQYFILYSLFIFPVAMILHTISHFTNKGIIYFDPDKIQIRTWPKEVLIEVKELTKIIFVDQENILNRKFAHKFILQTIWGKVYRLKLLEIERTDELIETIEFYKTDRLKISAELIDPTDEFDDSNSVVEL
jgi:hypothetical protein